MHVEKLCLSLYYTCSKFHQYILSSHCVVICQHDVVKCMMQRPILSGRMGKWAYSLVEYELSYEPLKAVKGLVVADFIIDHGIHLDDADLVTVLLWKVFFNGSVCAKGCGTRYVVVSPGGVMQEMAERLGFRCTYNQSEYEALIVGLRHVIGTGVKDVEAFDDSQLVMQQVRGESQCLDGTLNQCCGMCAQLVSGLDTFHIEHVHKGCNGIANELAQHASGYEVKRGRFNIRK
jgi:ribonuclease HI